ncbi:hypothetical protein RhiirA1_491536 [Rhizophagus irregularis]|uniref:Uncharacterized protein n=2 Tax=Rhizophagus irregularis TaxID=588596 RepID=U9TTU7_RHIID|nr:hypothetical protein GLOIN_2v1606564 [Rhizophagus irregularis DAOM 181602=DAOM 197198]PKC60042.1 hypothetical protein RhiirA1_491536 [Rhizophagus irregularis]PKY31566.1 hypothetical protein RhiirB3_531645 [Rhizophagus irregularis]POG71302.1 hypothetical protein GLOIN_2v1606564 [Rhizophagus irregularis DAOM 181602=DAOM 197198]UZO27728.1 hypothetical protein OCT59_019915 [Rhizophagus irregularis]CAB4482428.1 unnamed protein product [Rhizophagus irregularis]|eukprot:XP_025178168.1 hypothetical protein GLOIN_2v1606564 [Rhizophagus irregularis DAOM 181602=DAOM 197198]
MVVKNIKLLFSFLLCMINILIIQPSLASCETVDIKIFGIKVSSTEVGELTKGKEIGYIVLNYILSGLCALAIALVVLFLCCIFICCTSKRRENDEERGVHDHEDDDEDEDDDGVVNDQNPDGRTEKSSNDERNKNEEDEK